MEIIFAASSLKEVLTGDRSLCCKTCEWVGDGEGEGEGGVEF